MKSENGRSLPEAYELLMAIGGVSCNQHYAKWVTPQLLLSILQDVKRRYRGYPELDMRLISTMLSQTHSVEVRDFNEFAEHWNNTDKVWVRTTIDSVILLKLSRRHRENSEKFFEQHFSGWTMSAIENLAGKFGGLRSCSRKLKIEIAKHNKLKVLL